MKNLFVTSLILMAGALFTVNAAEELLINGSLEQGLAGWTAVPGSGTIYEWYPPDSNPFTNVYPKSTNVIALVDDVLATTPYVYQVFNNKTHGLLKFNFDLGFPSAFNGNGWEVDLYNGNSTSDGLKFLIASGADASYYFVAYDGATARQVCTISQGYYYNITGTINLDNGTYSG